jgi:hypothetical protein
MLEISMKSNTSTQNDRLEYRLRIQASPNNPDRVMFEYLMNQGTADCSHREMALAALRAYWMPVAYEHYRHQFDFPFSDPQLRQMARNAIAHLRERAEILNHLFCVDLCDVAIPPFQAEDHLFLISQQEPISPNLVEDIWLSGDHVFLQAN